uniref:Uncharacterized protein n=1 Tax=Mucochytrium quahogii TaxID=96639 RepID=A0A7S2W8F1_9STRA|mmetsp:Transcript_16330/g.35548  ORF Transcript_16330/g.35548 Transcript_16330/m.35548 type:complete len:1030 (+) Transcript_16330:1565-4654(+)
MNTKIGLILASMLFLTRAADIQVYYTFLKPPSPYRFRDETFLEETDHLHRAIIVSGPSTGQLEVLGWAERAPPGASRWRVKFKEQSFLQLKPGVSFYIPSLQAAVRDKALARTQAEIYPFPLVPETPPEDPRVPLATPSRRRFRFLCIPQRPQPATGETPAAAPDQILSNIFLFTEVDGTRELDRACFSQMTYEDLGGCLIDPTNMCRLVKGIKNYLGWLGIGTIPDEALLQTSVTPSLISTVPEAQCRVCCQPTPSTWKVEMGSDECMQTYELMKHLDQSGSDEYPILTAPEDCKDEDEPPKFDPSHFDKEKCKKLRRGCQHWFPEEVFQDVDDVSTAIVGTSAVVTMLGCAAGVLASLGGAACTVASAGACAAGEVEVAMITASWCSAAFAVTAVTGVAKAAVELSKLQEMGNQPLETKFTYDKCINPEITGCSSSLLQSVDVQSSDRPTLNFVGDNLKVGLYFRLNHKLFETAPVRPNSSDVLHYANCKSETKFTLPAAATLDAVQVNNSVGSMSTLTFFVEEVGELNQEQLRFKNSVCRGLRDCDAFQDHMISIRDFKKYPGAENHSYEVTTPMVFVQSEVACVVPFTMVKGEVSSSTNWRVGGSQCVPRSDSTLYCKCAGLSDKWLVLRRPTDNQRISNGDEYLSASIESTNLPEISSRIHPASIYCHGHIKHATTRQLVFESREPPGKNGFMLCEAILKDEDGNKIEILRASSTGIAFGSKEADVYGGTRSSSSPHCASVRATRTGKSRLTLTFEAGKEPQWLEIIPRNECDSCNKNLALAAVDVYLDGLQILTLEATDKPKTYGLKPAAVHELVFENSISTRLFTICEVELRNAEGDLLPIVGSSSTKMEEGAAASFAFDGETDGTDPFKCAKLYIPTTGPARLTLRFLGELKSLKIYPRTDWSGAKDRLKHVKVKLDGVEIATLIGSDKPELYTKGNVTLVMNPQDIHGFNLCEISVFDEQNNRITLSSPQSGQIYRGTPEALTDGSDSTCLHLLHRDSQNYWTANYFHPFPPSTVESNHG